MRTSPRTRVGRLAAAAALALGLAAAPLVSAGPAAAAGTPAITIFVPNLIQAGVPTTLVATVSNGTSTAPAGTVTFSTGYGSALGTATLVAGTTGTSTASYAWTPPPAFTVPVLATYTPTGATAAAAASVVMNPQITTAPVPVALRFAPTLYAGATELSGVLGYNFGPGSVSFLVDGAGWTGSVPTVNGVGSVTWQATPGIHTITVQYSSNAANPVGVSLQTGESTQIVNVLPAP